jgi:hypothetical protein
MIETRPAAGDANDTRASSGVHAWSRLVAIPLALLAAVAWYLLLFTFSVALLAMSIVLPLLLLGSLFSVGWQFAFGAGGL